MAEPVSQEPSTPEWGAARRLSRGRARWSIFQEMFSYGAHSFVANSANWFLNQGPPVVTGPFPPAEFFGFFTLPLRRLPYGIDAVSRVGLVTRSRTAVLGALQV